MNPHSQPTSFLSYSPLFLIGLLLVSAGGCEMPQREPAQTELSATGPIKWVSYSDDVFAQAKREHKFVLLDLEAVWCHWCHVMDQTTYADPQVRQLIGDRYIAVRVDQDSRPDLSSRYENYGWPATVVFAADGSEIVKRQGYVAPAAMASMLRAIDRDPTPGPSIEKAAAISANDASALSYDVRKTLIDRLNTAYDDRLGAWGDSQKFLGWDNVEYCLIHASDPRYQKMARQTLTAQLQLLDPAWGGVYQYSTNGDWQHPHFEKIMQMQAENLRIYSQAYALWHNDVDLHAAHAIQRYVRTFLTSPDGAFYTSQDADLWDGEHAAEYFAMDDAHRRAQGIPRMDTHIYARENGWMIAALVQLYCATGDNHALADAIRAADWIIANRATTDGGFHHGDADAVGPYLGDTLAMGRAVLSLYAATADRKWLDRASQAATFINGHFHDFVGFKTPVGNAATPEFDENVTLARFANLLFHYTGNASQRKIAEHAMQYLTAPQTATHHGYMVGGLLLADREISQDPIHITVLGLRDSTESLALFHTAIGYFDQYKRIDFFDPKVGPPPNTDVEFPVLTNPAAFLCTQTSCSAPMFDAKRLEARLKTNSAPSQ
jgi:uncharacterized protein YyaL (SSP411 family)